VKKNERLAGAMHAVKDMLAIDVGKIRIRHGGGLLLEWEGSQSALRSLIIVVLLIRPVVCSQGVGTKDEGRKTKVGQRAPLVFRPWSFIPDSTRTFATLY
jgi:hypothetical protein